MNHASSAITITTGVQRRPASSRAHPEGPIKLSAVTGFHTGYPQRQWISQKGLRALSPMSPHQVVQTLAFAGSIHSAPDATSHNPINSIRLRGTAEVDGGAPLRGTGMSRGGGSPQTGQAGSSARWMCRHSGQTVQTSGAGWVILNLRTGRARQPSNKTPR